MVSLSHLAVTFLKIGALGFGGPFSLLAIMQKEIVEYRKWMTTDDFTQSVGIGTMTPGPIFFAAAIFVGYRLRGFLARYLWARSTTSQFHSCHYHCRALCPGRTEPLGHRHITGYCSRCVGLFISAVLQMGRSRRKMYGARYGSSPFLWRWQFSE